jgi:hypothetical protein
MVGADEYYNVFRKTQQIGKLYIVLGDHARGKTFRVFILPEGEVAKPNGSMNAPLNKDSVEVYGITCGQAGWSEHYGWLHSGPWVNDFMEALASKKAINAKNKEARQQKIKNDEAKEESILKSLLDKY